MIAPISRRTFLAAGATAVGLSLPGVAAYARDHSNERVGFTLNAEVLDGGEQVTSITLQTARLGPIDPASLTTGTFSVHAKATSPITIASFVQGRLSDPEVDAFSYHISGSGMKYRLYSPTHGGDPRSAGRGKHPLVVWLHGGGEGALLPDNYYDNETTLRANRGALGFATQQAQRIFSGAYVVAPQSTSFWLEAGDRFAPLIREIIF